MKNIFLRVADRLIARQAAHPSRIRRTGQSFDVLDVAFWRAAEEAAEFYTQRLTQAKAFTDTLAMIRDGAALARPDGLFLEFGVATGRTIRAIAETHDGTVFGFDSFEGLPEDWYEGYPKGHFATNALPDVPANVSLIKGWFHDTLPGFLAEHSEPVSFINVDCDLYSSTGFVLDALADRLRPGSVIQFDEYFNYPGWREHEFKAFGELVERRNLKFRYHSFLRTHQAVCVVLE